MVVVDETSMVSLTMMARLLEAVRPDCRLVLVGDPDQLASVEAGAVLADLVDGLVARDDSPVVAALTTSHRFGAAIGGLAAAVRGGDADAALDAAGGRGRARRAGSTRRPDAWPGSATGWSRHAAAAARGRRAPGDASAALATLDRHRLLCAHRDGPCGVRHWNRQVERWLAERDRATDRRDRSEWYAGRPLLVTANDYGLGLFNGDTGVVVAVGRRASRAAIAVPGGHRDLRDLAAHRRRDHARDDRAQEPGQPGRPRSPCCCRPTTRGC